MDIDFEEEGADYREPWAPVPPPDEAFRQVQRFVVRMQTHGQELNLVLPGNLFEARDRLATRAEVRAIASSLVRALNQATGRIERGEFGEPEDEPYPF